MSEDERNALRWLPYLIVGTVFPVVIPVYPISMWFHRHAGWPLFGIAPLVCFGLRSMLETIRLGWNVRRGCIRSARALVCMLVGTSALWASLLIEARQGVAYPMPVSVAAAVLLAGCWLVIARDLRGKNWPADPQTDVEP